MRLVVRSSFQIHSFVNYLFGVGVTVQKNRVVQIASCVPTFISTLESLQGIQSQTEL